AGSTNIGTIGAAAILPGLQTISSAAVTLSVSRMLVPLVTTTAPTLSAITVQSNQSFLLASSAAITLSAAGQTVNSGTGNIGLYTTAGAINESAGLLTLQGSNVLAYGTGGLFTGLGTTTAFAVNFNAANSIVTNGISTATSGNGASAALTLNAGGVIV